MPFPNISIRRSIARGSSPPSEPTSTLVLTSSESRFIDIRLLLTPPSTTLPAPPLPPSSLDWAFAGTSRTIPRSAIGDEVGTLRGIWEHWVDSRVPLEFVEYGTPPDEAAPPDEGDLYSQANGDVLEKGAMVDPATGKMTAYEEVWGDVGVARTGKDRDRVCVVMRMEDEEGRARGCVIRVGQYVQGLLMIGEEIGLERWRWVGEATGEGEDGEDGGRGSWKREAKIGRWFIPCEETFTPDKLVVRPGIWGGDEDNRRWLVTEKYEW